MSRDPRSVTAEELRHVLAGFAEDQGEPDAAVIITQDDDEALVGEILWPGRDAHILRINRTGQEA